MKHDISVIRARTKVLRVYVTDSSGNPYELSTDEKLIFGVKKSYSDADYIIKKTAVLEDYDSETHSYSFTITPSDTSDLAISTYYYDVGLQNGTNYFTVIEPSRFILVGNVTEREV